MLRYIMDRAGFRQGKSIKKTQGPVDLEFIANFIPSNPVILEAGAHAGIDTVKLAQRWPSSIVHAFEPVAQVFAQLEANTSNLTNVCRHKIALGPKDETAEMYISGGGSDGSSSLLPPSGHIGFHPEVSFRDRERVECSTIQSWAKNHNIEKIDFMWLDMQGAEMDALRSAGKLLANVRLIYSEVSLIELYKGAPLYKEFEAWMNKQGFYVIREDLPWEDAGNVAFLRV